MSAAAVVMEPYGDVRLSVVLCTFRRPELLVAAVESLLKQTLAPQLYEIVVVDNDSRDATPERVQELAGRANTSVRYVFEAQRGLCHARNRGVDAAAGDVVVFFDDDALAPPEWLERLLAAFDADADLAAVGGPIAGRFEAERPEWLPADLNGWLSLLDHGDLERDLRDDEWLYGGNFAIRTSVLTRLGGFSPELGRRGTQQLDSEEFELQVRLRAAGLRVRYLPAARIEHRVPAERLTRGYFRRRARGAGRSHAVRMALENGRAPLAAQLLRRTLALPFLAVARLGARGPEGLRRAIRLQRCAGFALEAPRALSVVRTPKPKE